MSSGAAGACSGGGGDSSGEEGGLQIDVSKGDGSKNKVTKTGKVAKTAPDVWKAGDVVWAKVSGFNYWPAKVFDPADRKMVPKWLSEPPKPNYSLVRFFGSYDMQWVTNRLVEGYEKGFKKKFQTKCRSKLFQKSIKEVQEYVESGLTPEGLTQAIEDPDAHSSEEEEEQKEEEKVGVASVDDQPPSKQTENKVGDAVAQKTDREETKVPTPASIEPTPANIEQPSEIAPQSTNGSRSRRRKGSPRKLSTSSTDNEECKPPKKARLDTQGETSNATAEKAGDRNSTNKQVEAFTSAPLPLTGNQKKPPHTKAVKV